MNREPTMVDVALDAARRIGAASRDDEIAKLKAENKRLREVLNAIAEGEIYPVQVALAALAATEPPIGADRRPG